MKLFFTLPLRYLLGRRLRTTLTTLAVVFGVAVIFGVNVLLPTMFATLQGSIQGAAGQADLTISSAIGESFSSAAVDTVKGVAGVAAVSPSLHRQANTLPGATTLSTPLEMVGLDPQQALNVKPYPVSEGRFLQAGDTRAVVLDPTLANILKLKVGDTLQLPTPQGLTALTVVGLFGRTGGGEAFIPLATMQQLFNLPDRITTIDLVLGAGATADSVKATLQDKLGSQYVVGGAGSGTGAFASIQIALVALNFFGVMALFMGGFLIFNTFRTIVVERRHDIGMLRAVGATRRTIIGLILAESLWQGIIGTAVGLLLGYGFAVGIVGLVGSITEQYLKVRLGTLIVTPGTLALAVGLGVGVTLLAGLFPAWGASRVPVLAALRPAPPAPTGQRVSRGTLIGLGLLVLAAVGLISGTQAGAALGAILALVALIMLAPAFVHPLARWGEVVLRPFFASEGAMAAGNLARQPGRAAVTASALMIALAIIVALSGILTSIEATFLTYLDNSYGADILILPPAIALWNSEVGVGPEFEPKLAAIPGIGAAASLRYAGAQVNGVTVQLLGIDPDKYPQVAGLTFDQGEAGAYAALRDGRAAIANPIYAGAHQLKIGDMLHVQTPDGAQDYRLVAIGTDYLAAKVNSIYISQHNLATDFHRNEDVLVMANLAPGANRDTVKASVDQLLQSYPQFSMTWGADWRADARKTFEQIYLALYAILAVFAIPALLGMINTLAINILERTREIGVLRAIGTTRRQVQRLVLAESVLLGAAGAGLGMLAGLALGYGFTTLTAGGFGNTIAYTFPLAGLIAAIATALILGVLASWVPARQAARLRIVQALQYE